MKTFKLSLVFLLILGALSCKKENTENVTVTTDQAADLAAGSLAADSFGLTTVSENLAASAPGSTSSASNGSQSVNSLGTASAHQECGSTLTDSLTNSGTNGTQTFSYFLRVARTLNCNANNQPDNLANAVSFHGNFDGPNLTLTSTGTAVFTLAGLTTQASSFVLNGEYKRAGTFQSKVGNKTSGESNIDIVATNIAVSKITRKITGGNATISIIGSTSKNGSFSYTGNIVFNGDGTAILTINGSIYNVDLVTGIKTKH
jgi:hypothetical protein